MYGINQSVPSGCVVQRCKFVSQTQGWPGNERAELILPLIGVPAANSVMLRRRYLSPLSESPARVGTAVRLGHPTTNKP